MQIATWMIHALNTPSFQSQDLLSGLLILLNLILTSGMTLQAVGHPPQAMRPVTFFQQAADPVVVEQDRARAERRAELVTGAA